jgi:hypothetical protein
MGYVVASRSIFVCPTLRYTQLTKTAARIDEPSLVLHREGSECLLCEWHDADVRDGV